jgi:uncharacterized membrane protein YkvA (DUF1232 family)
MPTQDGDFYQDLRKRFRDWAGTEEGKSNKFTEILMFAPDLFHLLCKLAIDPDVPVKEKAKLAAAIAYFVSPIDLIPEAILGPVGYVDDIALAAYVLNNIINKTGEEVVTRHWAGEADVLVVIQRIIAVADEMVGSGLWRKLKGLVD